MDPLIPSGIAVLAGGIFAGASLVALVTIFPFRRVPRTSGWIAAGALVVFVAALLASPPGYDPYEIDRIE